MCIIIEWMCPGCTGSCAIGRELSCCDAWNPSLGHSKPGDCGRPIGWKPLFPEPEQLEGFTCVNACPFNPTFRREGRARLERFHAELARLPVLDEGEASRVQRPGGRRSEDDAVLVEADEVEGTVTVPEAKPDDEGENSDSEATVVAEGATSGRAARERRKLVRNAWYDDEIEELRRLRAEGKTHEEIARVGRCPVHDYVPRGLTFSSIQILTRHTKLSIQIKWGRISRE
jgi:hypothetical protein